MIDPKTAWLITKTTSNILILLLKCAALIGVIYFALFTTSYFIPYFTTANNHTLAHEAEIVYICCFVVIAFLTLLIGEQLLGMLLSLCPGRCLSCKPKTLWFRISYIIVVAFLLATVLFGTLYPLLKALAWRGVFAAAGRADLEEQATALVAFMGITLAVGMVSLLKLSWGLVVQGWGAARLWCGRKMIGSGKKTTNGIPLKDLAGRGLARMV